MWKRGPECPGGAPRELVRPARMVFVYEQPPEPDPRVSGKALRGARSARGGPPRRLQLRCRLYDGVGGDAELLHHLVAWRREPEAVDADDGAVEADVGGPGGGHAGFDGDAAAAGLG